MSSVNIKQKLTLSTEQQKVLSLVVAEGKNIFFTGSAGEMNDPPTWTRPLTILEQGLASPFCCEKSSNPFAGSMRQPPMLLPSLLRRVLQHVTSAA